MKARGSFVPEGFGSRLDAFMDVVRFGPELLKLSEFAALLFHVERSLGYGKNADAPSLNQMARGIDYRKTGQRIRGSAGISKAGCAQANITLEKFGLIKRQTRQRKNGGHDSTSYEVQWSKLNDFFVKTVGETSRCHSPEFRQALVQNLDKGVVQKLDKPLVQKLDNYRVDSKQSSSSSGEMKTESSALDAASSTANRRKARAEEQSHSASGQSGIPKQKAKPIPVFSNRADDEKPPAREPLADPRAEFRERMRGRHPNLDAEDLLKIVEVELNNGNAGLLEFLELDAKRTTNPGRLGNPGGHYRELARILCKESLGFQPGKIQRLAGQGIPAYKCAKCYSIKPGEGMLFDKDVGAFVFCECASEAYRLKAEAQLKQFNEPRHQSEGTGKGC